MLCRENILPTIRPALSSPFIFCITALSLIPGLILIAFFYDTTALIGGIAGIASAIVALFLMRLILSKDRSLVLPVGFASGIIFSASIPVELSVYIPSVCITAAILLTQLLHLIRVRIRFSISAIAIAIYLAIMLIKGGAVVSAPYHLPFFIPEPSLTGKKGLLDLISALSMNGIFPAQGIIPMLLAIPVMVISGIVRKRHLIMSVIGGAMIFAIMTFAIHQKLEWTTLVYAAFCLLFASIYLMGDPLSSARSNIGKIILFFLFGAIWMTLYYFTFNPLVASLSSIGTSLLTPAVNLLTRPKPFGV
jgi:Na+-translocating ferredoxin:NAD+ oxidoreductase RnfD subunit